MSDLPSSPDRPPAPGRISYPPRPPPSLHYLRVKSWSPNPSLTMRLCFAGEELEHAIYIHDRYLNDYRVAHRKIHDAYVFKRVLDSVKRRQPAIPLDDALESFHRLRDKASDAMRVARENVKVLREDIKRMKETVVTLEKQVAAEQVTAEKSGVVVNTERATT